MFTFEGELAEGDEALPSKSGDLGLSGHLKVICYGNLRNMTCNKGCLVSVTDLITLVIYCDDQSAK